jgi:hypothetical protein
MNLVAMAIRLNPLGMLCPDVSTTPITAMGCRQWLPLSFMYLKLREVNIAENPIAEMGL